MQRSVFGSTILTLAITGCGGGDGDGRPTTIDVDTIGPPTLVAVRQGDGDWQTLAVAGNRYQIDVTEPYVVAVVCNDVAGLIDSYQFARTPDDDPAIEAPCTGDNPPANGAAQGTMVQAGEVVVRFQSQTVDTPNGAFDIPVFDGTHDLIAFDDSRIVVRRGIATAGATAIGAVDLATEGAARLPPALTITNATPQESPFGVIELFTEHDTLGLIGFGGPDQLRLAPDAVLGAADRQGVFMSASLDDTARRVSLKDVRESTARAITLPDPLVGASLDESGGQIAATWGALPDHDALLVTLDQTRDDTTGTFVFHDLTISKAYEEATGTSIVFDQDIPGFDDAWRIDVTKEYTRSFEASRNRSDNETASSQLSQSVNAPSAKPHRLERALAKPYRLPIR